MTAESLDAELLKDLRGLGKLLSFDGNDAEYQDFRFSFRIHMSLDSSVSHEMMKWTSMMEFMSTLKGQNLRATLESVFVIRKENWDLEPSTAGS